VIGADDITVNLNGHNVGGNGLPNTDGFDVGIRVESHHQVTVTNGSVAGFDLGLLFDASPRSAVTAMQVHDNSRRGITLANGSDHGQIKENLATHNGGRNGGGGIVLLSSDDAVVTGNALTGNHVGVGVEDDANDNQISGNRFIDNPQAAVEIGFNDGNTVAHNVITRSGGGVVLESANNTTITDNQILHSTAPDGIGIQIYGNHNLVARNTVIDSIRYAIEVDDFQDPGHSPVIGNVLRDNLVRDANEGIAIGSEAGGVVLDTLIEGNFVSGAVDDGIQLVGPSTGLETSTLTGNVAVHNGDLGIETVPGTIDGGGNRAYANVNPIQCLNITCH
jgi:parallel beta-helix repeat protein